MALAVRNRALCAQIDSFWRIIDSVHRGVNGSVSFAAHGCSTDQGRHDGAGQWQILQAVGSG
jgi:hypothetical protein